MFVKFGTYNFEELFKLHLRNRIPDRGEYFKFLSSLVRVIGDE